MSEGQKSDWKIGAGIIGTGVAAGFFIWYSAPWLIDHQGYWESDDGLFWVYLLTVGVISGLICPRWWWAPAFGIYIGQVIGTWYCLPSDPLLPLGWFVTLPIASLATLAGTAVGAIMRVALGTARRRFLFVASAPFILPICLTAFRIAVA